MITLRKADERGKTQTSWLTSFHTFSFADYYDPKYMAFSHLRVINEDIIHSNKGFGRHPHQNMEIITYIIEGALEHKDSMGTGAVIECGDIQRMSAGVGVEHSEFNNSNSERVHLLQIWITPDKNDINPSYEQKTIVTLPNKLILIGEREPKGNAITIHQDVRLYKASLTSGSSISYAFDEERAGWLQLIKGKIEINGQSLLPGDGAGIRDEESITIISSESAELLFFDLP